MNCFQFLFTFLDIFLTNISQNLRNSDPNYTTTSSSPSTLFTKISQAQNNTAAKQQKTDSNNNHYTSLTCTPRKTVIQESSSSSGSCNCKPPRAISISTAAKNRKKLNMMLDNSNDPFVINKKWGSLRQNHPIQNPFHRNRDVTG